MSNDSNVPPTARGLPHKDSWGSFWLSATRGPKSVWGSFGHMVWVWTERGRRGSLPCHRIGARQRRSDAGAPRVHDAHLQHGPLDPDPYAAAQAFARHPSRCGLQNMCSRPLTGWRQTSPRVSNRVHQHHSRFSVSQKYIDQVALSFRLFQASSKPSPKQCPWRGPSPPSSLTNPPPPSPARLVRFDPGPAPAHPGPDLRRGTRAATPAHGPVSSPPCPDRDQSIHDWNGVIALAFFYH